MKYQDILNEAGVAPKAIGGGSALEAHTPIDGSTLGFVPVDTAQSIEDKIRASVVAFTAWRSVPAPQRGELVRRIARRVRREKQALGKLISLEAGKILSEGLGEVQEVIDICDFAVGLSRQLYGLTVASERPGHHLVERWHPLGPVAVITAFNFPMAVWSWNAALALVCGNSVIWKPSEKTPLTALALHRILEEVAAEFPGAPPNLTQLVIGRREAGEQRNQGQRQQQRGSGPQRDRGHEPDGVRHPNTRCCAGSFIICPAHAQHAAMHASPKSTRS